MQSETAAAERSGPSPATETPDSFKKLFTSASTYNLQAVTLGYLRSSYEVA